MKQTLYQNTEADQISLHGSEAGKVIITGGPGSGKSTLIQQLNAAGYTCMEEVSRQIIRSESAKEDGVLPWNNLPEFAKLALASMQSQWMEAEKYNDPVFFDRGIPDIAAYLQCYGEKIPRHMEQSINEFGYANQVFWCPPWEDIYENDPERPQTYQEAVELGMMIKKIYQKYGYQVETLPFESVEHRIEYIMHSLHFV